MASSTLKISTHMTCRRLYEVRSVKEANTSLAPLSEVLLRFKRTHLEALDLSNIFLLNNVRN